MQCKNRKKKFSAGHRSSFWIKLSFGIGHPPSYTSNTMYMCGEGSRVPNLQTEFNYLDSFKSYGIFSDFVVPVVPMLSLSSPRCPRHPHIIPVLSPSSPHHPHSPQKVPMWSPLLWSPLSPPHVVPVVPMSSPLSPCHSHHPHIISKVPTSSLTPQIPTPPAPFTPLGWGAPNQ